MNSKCRSAVEHYQLIAMKDFRFSAPFKRACKLDITHYCPNIKIKYIKKIFKNVLNFHAFNNIMNRPQVVACLSEMVRNDSISLNMASHTGSQTHRVSQSCRQQIRNQILQQVQYNPIEIPPLDSHIFVF